MLTFPKTGPESQLPSKIATYIANKPADKFGGNYGRHRANLIIKTVKI